MALETFDKRAAHVKKSIVSASGKMPEATDDTTSATIKQLRESILIDMMAAVKQVDTMRAGTKDRKAVDISFGAYVQERWGFAPSANGTPESFYQAIGVNPSQATIATLMAMPDFDESYRWLLPEIIREAVRLGLRKAPIYSNLIAAEESVTQPTVILPHVNMSDAMPTKIGEAETIPTGNVTFGEKTVKLQKVGTGLKLTDEVQQYVSLNVLALYLQDVGVKMNIALDTMCVNTLINGDQTNGSNAAGVVGVQSTSAGFTYFDLLRAWIRMGMLGRLPQSILSNENPALSVLMLDEFRNRMYMLQPQGLNLRTPVPATTNYDIHGAMPADDQLMLIDATSALIKLNASALRVESERIASRQINGTYVTMTTGFANLFNDARLILDKSVSFASQGFPSYMNPTATVSEGFKD